VKEPNTQPEAADVARAFVDAVNRHSLVDLSNLMSDDHTFIDSSGRIQSGRDALLASWKMYFEWFPDYEIRVEETVSAGGTVAMFGQAAGTYNGKRGTQPENRITMPSAWKAKVRNGRLALWQVYADWTEGMKIVEREDGKG